MKKLIIIISLFTLVACGHTNSDTSQKVYTEKKKKSIEDANIITSSCAIFVRPDSIKIAKLRKENSEDDYNTIVDDNEYYMGISSAFLDSTKTKIIHRNASGILNFKTLTDKTYNLNLNSTYWGIILFNGKEKPVEADMTFINEDYESYMEK